MLGSLFATAVFTSLAAPQAARSAPKAAAPSAARVRKLTTLQGVEIVSAAGAPTGSLMALGQSNGAVRLVDASTGQTRRSLVGHPQPCYALAFSSDGRKIATGDESGRIWVWDVATGRKLVEYRREKGHKRGIQALAFAPGSSRLLSVGKDDVIFLWGPSGGDPVGTILGKGANFYGACILKNGNIVTGTLKEGLRLYRRDLTLAAAMTLPGGQGANQIASNATGSFVATAGRDGRAVFWSLATKKTVGGVKAHEDWVINVALAPQGKIIATSSNDRTVKFWDVKTGRRIAELDDMSSVGSPMAFSGSGRCFVAADMSDNAVIYALAPGM